MLNFFELFYTYLEGSCILYIQIINLSKYECLSKDIMADYGFKGVSLINIKENQCTHIILVCVL